MTSTVNMNIINETMNTKTIDSWEDIEMPIAVEVVPPATVEKAVVAPIIAPPSEAKLRAEANRNKALCRAFYDGSECTHPECYFAHSVEDLKIPSCNFGDKCRKITECRKTGALINHPRETYPCNRKHPSESMSAFYDRVGLTKYVGIVIIPKPRKQVIEDKPKTYKKKVESAVKKTVVSKTVPKTEEESVIEIPRELALEALKLLLASGKNVKVEFK